MPPSSVYRLQLTPFFTFSEAAAVVPYLRELGVDAVYASPFFEARPGSTHGYDNTSPLKIREELGGEAGFEAFVAMLKECSMGLIIDLVSNHMAASEHNEWWVDVLKHGKKSKYAHFFDIDWFPARKDLHGKVYLPILEGPLQRELEAGKIQLYENHLEAGWQKLPLAPGSKGSLEEVLAMQHYRLAFWESGPQHVNYRRFFDINELAALRVEDQEVFDAVHEKVFQLVKEGKVQGIRVDHPDGFYEPKRFFKELRKCGVKFVVAEKILKHDEELRNDWDVDGTVGYEFLTQLSGLFIDRSNEKAFTRIYETFIGKTVDEKRLLYEQKRQFALFSMASEIKALTHRLVKSSGLEFEELYEGIVDLIASFPVYRTYVEPEDSELSRLDRKWIEKAFGTLETYSTRDVSFLKRWLSLEVGHREELLRFQQLTSPIMAKGFEDTHLYVYNRFLALNEVGGNPHDFGTDIQEFHTSQEKRRGLLPLSTHDTKRSGDVRMRLAVLSEIPDEWEQCVNEWRAMLVEIEPNVLYFFFQTLVGMWDPEEDKAIFAQRLCDYMVKAQREAKVHTSWLNNDVNFEHALTAFVREALENKKFMRHFLAFVERIDECGRKNSLSALTIKLGSAGTVDIYQGNELFDFSVVDPDNRRQVDFEKRIHMLGKVKHLRDFNYDELKLFITWKGLQARRTFPEVFVTGDYTPLETKGNLIAFMRDKAVIFAKRLHTKKCSGKIILPKAMKLENIFTDETFEGKEFTCAQLTKILPVGILL